MKLYMHPVSMTSRPVRLFIAESGMKVDEELVDLMTGAHLKEPFVSINPNRLVPVVTRPEHIMIAVSGDPLRSNCYLFVHNGMLGFPTTKAVKLPQAWRAKLRDAQA